MNKLIEKVDQITKQVSEEFGLLNEAQLNWKPTTDTWSIAQNIDHLIVINETYFPIFDELKTGTYTTPFLGKIGFIVNFFGNFILKSVEPTNKKKIKTFPIWEPDRSDISVDILDRFAQHQEQLKKYLKELRPFSDNNIVITSPANKNIVYKLSKAIEIIIKHEQRHLEQAKRINNTRLNNI